MLLLDCCMCIPLAMSKGLVSILLYLSVMQSRGGDSWLLKTFLCIRLGLLSYSCLYLDMAFLTQSWVYFVVIVRARVLAVFAIVAIVMNHSCCRFSWFESGGMVVYLWLLSCSMIGCVCHCLMCFAM